MSYLEYCFHLEVVKIDEVFFVVSLASNSQAISPAQIMRYFESAYLNARK